MAMRLRLLPDPTYRARSSSSFFLHGLRLLPDSTYSGRSSPILGPRRFPQQSELWVCCLPHANPSSLSSPSALQPIVELEPKGSGVAGSKNSLNSLELEIKDRPTSISTNIDWLGLSEEEFDAHLNDLRSKVPGFSPSMLSSQEGKEFCARRHHFLGKCMDSLAELVGDNDLIIHLKELREEDKCKNYLQKLYIKTDMTEPSR